MCSQWEVWKNAVHYEHLDVTLNNVAEGEGPLFTLEMVAKDVLTIVNIAELYKYKLLD